MKENKHTIMKILLKWVSHELIFLHKYNYPLAVILIFIFIYGSVRNEIITSFYS